MQINKENDSAVLKLEGVFDISVAGELQKQLIEYLAGTSEAVLDLGGAETFDTAALQVLYAARKTAASSNRELRFIGVSGPVSELCAALGLGIKDLGGEAAADAL